MPQPYRGKDVPAAEPARHTPTRTPDGPHAAVLALQRSAGNRATARLIAQAPEAMVARAPSLRQRWDKYWADAPTRAKARETEPYARTKAKELIRAAEDIEPRVTGHIRSIAFGRRGKPKGLEYRIKSVDSLARKLRDKAAENPLASLAPGKAVEQEAQGINDTLRYTVILEPDQSYGNLYSDISDKMAKYSYKEGLRKNYWEKSTTYKGINLTFTTSGTRPIGFEVQLHTEASFATKQLNHKEYEEERELGTTPERRQLLNDTMEKRWEEVKVPRDFTSKRPAARA